MSFTRSWDESVPNGAVVNASDIDLYMRYLKVDIRERLDEILGVAGAFDNGTIIDGTILKDIASLVTLVGTKSTISGLTTGTIPKAGSASTIVNSSVTEAQLAAAVTVTTAAATEDSTSTTNTTKFSLALSAGTYLITFHGQSTGSVDYAIIDGGTANDQIRQDYSNGLPNFCITALLTVSGTVTCECGGGAGTYYVNYKKLA